MGPGAHVPPMRLGRGFLRIAATTDCHKRHAADVALIRAGVVMNRSGLAARATDNGQDVVRFYAGNADPERRMGKGASPLRRQLQIEAFVAIWQAVIAGRCSATAASLKTITGTTSAGIRRTG